MITDIDKIEEQIADVLKPLEARTRPSVTLVGNPLPDEPKATPALSQRLPEPTITERLIEMQNRHDAYRAEMNDRIDALRTEINQRFEDTSDRINLVLATLNDRL